MTRIRQKHATPSATPAAATIAPAVAQSEALLPAAESTVDADPEPSAIEEAAVLRRYRRPDVPGKGVAPVLITQTGFIPKHANHGPSPSEGWVGPIDPGWAPGKRKPRRPPPSPITPYRPNNA